MNNRPFGHTPLLELPLYDKVDELQVREHLFQHHTIEQEALGGVWHGGVEVRPQNFYNPAVDARELREYQQERAAIQAEIDAERRAHREYKSARAKAREVIEAAKERARFEHERVVQKREAEEAAWREANQKVLDAIEHERKRAWAIHTSKVEQQITLVVDMIDASSGDRTMMRAMLRYMNLGPGLGKYWDAEAFTYYYSHARHSLHVLTRIDVDRCYLLLKQRDMVERFECQSQSLVT